MNKCKVMCESCEKGNYKDIYICLGTFCFDCEVGSDCEAMCSTLYADFVCVEWMC